MITWLSHVLDRVFVVVGAFLCSQIPAFMQQYTQRLGGHLSELNHQLVQLQKVAKLSGKTLPEYVAKFQASGDLDFIRQGELMQQLIERQQVLTQALTQLIHADTVQRPLIFIRHLQIDIAQGTMQSFQPSLTFSGEGLFYALLGVLVGYGIYALFLRAVALIGRMGRKHQSCRL